QESHFSKPFRDPWLDKFSRGARPCGFSPNECEDQPTNEHFWGNFLNNSSGGRTMKSTTKRRVNYSALLRTASFLAIGTALTTQAQAQAQMAQDMGVPEQVLVTGSLIHGAAVVGVPVTALNEQDFQETGALTTSDLLKEVPSLAVLPSNS